MVDRRVRSRCLVLQTHVLFHIQWQITQSPAQANNSLEPLQSIVKKHIIREFDSLVRFAPKWYPSLPDPSGQKLTRNPSHLVCVWLRSSFFFPLTLSIWVKVIPNGSWTPDPHITSEPQVTPGLFHRTAFTPTRDCNLRSPEACMMSENAWEVLSLI